jgi:hypothetical protein
MNQGEIIVTGHFEGELYINGCPYHRAIKAAVESEREACAKIVEQYTGAWDDQGYALAQAIRARGEK